METFDARERDNARYMQLDGAADSEPAKQMVDSLALGFARRTSTRKPSKPFTAAVGALLCDLLRNAEGNPVRWGYRSLGHDTFSRQRIGCRAFVRAVVEMEHHGALERRLGHQQWSNMGDGPATLSWARATRFRGTRWLFRLAAESGVTPENWAQHFAVIEPEKASAIRSPLVCRRSKSRIAGERRKGADVRLDLSDPMVRALHDRVVRLNEFFSDHVIGGQQHLGFRRIFNEGGEAGYRWNKGGRLNSIGGGYQTAKKAERAAMTIDGEPVVEIDIRASQLTILHALNDLPINAAEDPYLVEGIPREVVKAWILMTLGHDRLHSRWSESAEEQVRARFEFDLQAEFPLGKTRDAILAKLPVLADWGTGSFGALDLQYIESEIVVAAVETLAFVHGVPGLPVHDSIIVPASRQELARLVLSEAFEHEVGVRPHLKVG